MRFKIERQIVSQFSFVATNIFALRFAALKNSCKSKSEDEMR